MRATLYALTILATVASIAVPGMFVFVIVFWWHASLHSRRRRDDQRLAIQRANQEQRRREADLIRAARSFR